MIERYARQEMAAIWGDERRLQLILEVEAAFLEALAEKKGIPAAEIRALRAVFRKSLVERVRRQEAESGHELVALLQVVSEEVRGEAPSVARYLHYGLTSSDVLDTVLALQLRESAGLLLKGWGAVAAGIRTLARKHENSWMAGRTHGVHAEPTTFGIKLAGWYTEAGRNMERMERSRMAIGYGKMSGAVGTYSQLPSSLEASVCQRLGLRPEPVSTQVVPRDRHAEYFHALALSAAAIERFATEVRHLQRTEVLELEEPFAERQKGSSAMPHKRNPVLCENLCGLSRLLRSYGSAVVENIILWHERDISHSSVERVVLPDAAILLDFMLHRFAGVLEGLRVHPERMRENLDRSLGLPFSQKVLLTLVDKGLDRFKAYSLVQRGAMKSWKTRTEFRRILAEDKQVSRLLSRRELEECFSLDGYGASAREILKRAGIS